MILGSHVDCITFVHTRKFNDVHVNKIACGGAITGFALRRWWALGRRLSVIQKFSHFCCPQFNK